MVWDAARDVGALHTRLVPGFAVDTQLEEGARIVTFANGVVREPPRSWRGGVRLGRLSRHRRVFRARRANRPRLARATRPTQRGVLSARGSADRRTALTLAPTQAAQESPVQR